MVHIELFIEKEINLFRLTIPFTFLPLTPLDLLLFGLQSTNYPTSGFCPRPATEL